MSITDSAPEQFWKSICELFLFEKHSRDSSGYRDWSEAKLGTLLYIYKIIVVAQYYDTDVNKEYAIRGNSAILKCVVPSFVADFVKVLSWHTDQGEEFVPSDDFGIT